MGKVTQENKVTKVSKEQDVKYKEQESANLKKSAGELTSDRDSSNAELSAVVQYLAKLSDMCVAKVETYEEKVRRRTAEIAGLKEASPFCLRVRSCKRLRRSIGLASTSTDPVQLRSILSLWSSWNPPRWTSLLCPQPHLIRTFSAARSRKKKKKKKSFCLNQLLKKKKKKKKS